MMTIRAQRIIQKDDWNKRLAPKSQLPFLSKRIKQLLASHFKAKKKNKQSSLLEVGNTIKLRETPKALSTKCRLKDTVMAELITLGNGKNNRDETMGNPQPSP